MDRPAEEHSNLVLNGEGKFMGVRGFFAHLERKKYKLHVRVFLSRYRGYSLCPDCNGSRLRLEARQVRIRDKNLCEICSLTVEDALKFFEQIEFSRAGSRDRRKTPAGNSREPAISERGRDWNT